jgi:hypothetical protein
LDSTNFTVSWIESAVPGSGELTEHRERAPGFSTRGSVAYDQSS